MPSSNSTNDTYFAMKSGLELAAACHERVRDFYQHLVRRVMFKRWSKAYRTYYGLSGGEDPFDVSSPAVAGDEGQLTSIRVNHAGSIMRRQTAMITQVVPDFEPVPSNSDYESLAQSDFCRKLLEYYMDHKAVGAKLFDAAHGAGIFGESRIEVAWDARGGPNLPPERINPEVPGRTKAGDLVFRVYTPLDLVRDLSRYDQDDDWVITRRFVNKWDVAARYPNEADDIIGLKSEEFPQSTTPTNRIEWERKFGGQDKSDLIPLYTLYHRKSDCLPNGKIAEFLSADILLYEGDLPYEEVPLVPISPGKMLRAPYGESPFHHLLALQDVYDLLASSVASNNAALALHLIFMPEGLDFSHMEISEGFAVIRGDAGVSGNLKPEVLNFNAPNDTALKFMEVMKDAMEQIGGINATVRGDPGPNIQSGSFAALIAQQAMEYAGAFQYSFQQAVAGVGNLIISILQQYADQPIVAEIAGQAHDYELVEFTKAKLDRIHRVTVRSGNPAARTPQFNIAMASDLLAKNMIPDIKTYITLVRTGEVETVIDESQTNDMRIRRENELLSKGQPHQVLLTDSHREDILHHASVLSSPAARSNPAIVNAVLLVVQQHLDMLRTADPDLMALIGQPSLMPGLAPSPDGAPPPDQGGQSGGGGPPGKPPSGEHQGASGPKGPHEPQPPKVGQGNPLPHQPNQPNNPLTGARASPHDGAIRS